ncbi:hypothetical protein Tsubulata_029254 [Turnera subulata]|uniref:Shikimate O-hydroxycinnamoyltransferase-like n=1 Tax=Turnera subulata TaxID=218843 RepID=A0A9Q0G6E3_9ROSI|nr:hypothetical protein Tsubulata_029254 [Turnera subulata]
MKLKIKESNIVTPAQETPNHRLWVSNLDVLQGRYHVPTLYFYKFNGSSNFFDGNLLKDSLSKALVPFYPVAGRLGRDENGRIEIHCNGEGVLFVEAETDSALTDFGDFPPMVEYMQLIPKVDYSRGLSSFPLLVVQKTTFSCGGACLGTGMIHTLADGTAALQFINTWSDMVRGLSLSIPPFLERTILRARDPPKPTFHHIEYDPLPTLNNPAPDQDSRPTSVANIKIRADQINALKAKVMSSKDKSTKVRYSTYEILTAHLWRCACRARGLPDDQATKLNMPVDGRARLYPPPPPNYFGNVIFQATPVALSGELVSEPLVETVDRIHRAIKQMDNEYLRSSIDCLEELGNPSIVMQGKETSRCPNFKINSWLRLPFYAADFGWGEPVCMRPGNVFEGKGYLLPTPTNDGGLTLAICLEADHMDSFQKLLYDF